MMKLPEHIKNATWDSFMEQQEGENDGLNVSLEVETQVLIIKVDHRALCHFQNFLSKEFNRLN